MEIFVPIQPFFQPHHHLLRQQRGPFCSPFKPFGFECRMERPKEDFNQKLEVRGFEPEDIKVELKPEERSVSVEAKKTTEENGFQMVKSFHKVLRIPEEFNVDELEAKFVGETLQIKAPLVKKAVEEKVAEEKKEEEKKEEAQPMEAEVEVHQEKAKKEEKMETTSNDKEEVKEHEVEIVVEKEEEKPVVQVRKEPFTASINVVGFKPDEISVEVTDNEGRVRVTAHHEEKDESDGSKSVRSLTKEYIVDPEVFDLETLSSSMTKEGLMTIEAEAKVQEEEKKKTFTNIPVNFQA